MRRSFTRWLTVPLVGAVLVAARSGAGADAGHPALAVLDTQVAAWNRGDLDGFCAAYAEDAVFVSPTGLTRGRAQVLARYRARYGSDGTRMGRLTLEPVEVKGGPELASVVARWTLSFEKKPPASGHTVIVMRRLAGSWQIVHDASM